MPSSTFLILSLLFSLLTPRGRAETVSLTLLDNDLRRHCSFDLHGYKYNLCPLMRSTKVVDVSGMTAQLQNWVLDSGRYVLVPSGLGEDGLVKTPDSGCDGDTWICVTSIQEDGPLSIPVIQKDESNDLTLIIEGNPDHVPSQLQLTFRGRKDLDVVFACSEDEKVDFVNGQSDHIRLMWASPHGCPKNSTIRRESKSTPYILTEEEQPDEQEEEGKGDKLLPSDNRKARTSIAFIIVFIILFIICGSTLASSARARHFLAEQFRSGSYAVLPVLAGVTLKLRPLGQSINSLTSKAMSAAGDRLRPGDDDDRVRWVQEEIDLDSDVMVNHHSSYQLDEESWYGLPNEYIPLAMSPAGSTFKPGQRVQSYGSVTEVATSQERGFVSRMKRYLRV